MAAVAVAVELSEIGGLIAGAEMVLVAVERESAAAGIEDDVHRLLVRADEDLPRIVSSHEHVGDRIALANADHHQLAPQGSTVVASGRRRASSSPNT